MVTVVCIILGFSQRKSVRKSGMRLKSIALQGRSCVSHLNRMLRKRKRILIAHSLSHASSKQNPGNSAPL